MNAAPLHTPEVIPLEIQRRRRSQCFGAEVFWVNITLMRCVLFFLVVGLFLVGDVRAEDTQNTPERLAKGVYRVSLTELVLLTSKEKPTERLALLFTRFAGAQATYRWLYFNPLTSDWVTGNGRVQEVYDKVPTSERGAVVVAVPGHNTRIEAGGISITWSRGDSKGSWIYFQPDHFEIKALPATEFDKIQ